MTSILVVDDSAVDRRLVGELLERRFECSVNYAVNGVEAMARLKDKATDLVVTDLTMPEMNGLELVTAVRKHFPAIPVILMTAYGSETLSIEALEKGAASYVPKSRLADKLPDTAKEVLTLAKADRCHAKLITCLDETNFVFTLDNDPAVVDPLVDLVQQMVSGMGLVDFTGRLQVGVAVKEAVLNAIFHGNLEITKEQVQEVEHELIQEGDLSLVEKRAAEDPYRHRRVYVEIHITPKEARFVICDDGNGFDLSAVPDLNEPGALEPVGRRGLSLIQTFMDEVLYNEKGNEVRLVKRKVQGANGVPS